jgi:flagellar protein FlgJ
MFDQQLAQNLAGKGSMGLAKLLENQFQGGSLEKAPEKSPESSAAFQQNKSASLPGGADSENGLAVALAALQARRAHLQNNPGNATLVAARPAPTADAKGVDGPRDFVGAIWPHAVEVSKVVGLPPHLMVAHSALESGWGKSEPRRADGSPSHNIFGVKAGRGWTGDVVEASTTEYVNGQPRVQVEKFRAYGSYREAFLDYANLLASSPRYASVLSANNGTDFANSLQQSGYATDPMYASKLTRILQGKTLRDALQS